MPQWNVTSQQRSARVQKFRDLWYGPRGDFEQSWGNYLKGDPLLKQAVIVIDLVYGGSERTRLSTSPVALDLADPRTAATVLARVGTTQLLLEEPEVELTYSLFSGSSSARTLSISVGNLRLNPWQLIMQQGRFLAGWGEVSLVAPGIDWGSRIVLMRGDMSGGVTFGGPREQMDLTLSDPKLTADLGVTEFVTSTDRFSDLPDSDTGTRFPLALNEPGPVQFVRVTATAPPTFLCCVGHEHDVSAVYVDGTAYTSGSVTYPWSVSYLYDDQGTAYTALVFGAGLGAWEDTTSVYGTLALLDATKSMNVVEVAEHLCEHWSLLGPSGVSKGAFARAASKLGSIAGKPGIYINGSGTSDATRALEYIESTLCGSFPMLSMAWQVGGYGPVLTDRRKPAVARWVVGQGPLLKRETGWSESDKADLYNWFTLRWGYDALTDDFAGVVLRNPGNSLLCRISEEQAGPLDMDPLESTLITDQATADWVADWLVAHRAIPSYTADYGAVSSVALQFALGDNIDLVDEEIYGCTFTNPVRATIESMTYRRGSCLVTLRLWPLLPDLTAAQTGATAFVGSGS